MDDPARKVERGVLGGGLQGGVVGSVSWGLVCQQALLPEKWQGQVSVVAPVQLCWKVICVPSKQPVPAAAQQNLVLKGESREAAFLLLGLPSPELGRREQLSERGQVPRVVFQSDLRSVEATGPKLGCLLGKEAIILEAIFKNQSMQNLRRNYP